MDRLGILTVPLILCAAIFYASAFFDGAAIWFDWQGLWVGAIFGIAIFFRGPGTIFITIVAAYGARYDWGWPWWQVALFVFPGFAFAALSAVLGGIASILRRLRQD